MFAVSLIDIFGWLGSAAVVLAYALISTDRLDSKSVTYHLLNLFGGACLVVNGAYYGAYPSAFVNIVWIMIAFSAVARMGQNLGERGRGRIPAKPSSKMN